MAEEPSIDPFILAIRCAQRDLIKRAGGIERVALITNRSTSAVGRWNGKRDTDIMPIPVVRILEEDTDAPLVTEAMAAAAGRRLTEADERSRVALSLIQCMAGDQANESELMSTILEALADGHVTPAEAHLCLQKLSDKEISEDRLKRCLIGAIAGGGLSVAGGRAAR
ncbi:hypothetical protein [Martelella sp. HB161492]|uniref:hypothetical protein n=1 Tax=Martelella sp. HB161492 TaxID=2720726 RepID=UPI00158FFF09|nr:hypothetical protein [Martelella sp. HB161492]